MIIIKELLFPVSLVMELGLDINVLVTESNAKTFVILGLGKSYSHYIAIDWDHNHTE